MVRLFYFSLSPCSQYGECHGDILLMGDDDEDIDDDTDTKSKQRIWTTAVVLSLANLSPQCCQAVIVVIDIFCHFLSLFVIIIIIFYCHHGDRFDIDDGNSQDLVDIYS